MGLRSFWRKDWHKDMSDRERINRNTGLSLQECIDKAKTYKDRSDLRIRNRSLYNYLLANDLLGEAHPRLYRRMTAGFVRDQLAKYGAEELKRVDRYAYNLAEQLGLIE